MRGPLYHHNKRILKKMEGGGGRVKLEIGSKGMVQGE